MTSSKQFLSGVKAGAPVILGFIPVAIAYAVMAEQAGIPTSYAVLMSVTVFAGASQMMASGMYVQGSGMLAIILATFILNLRHLIMSTCIMNRVKNTKTGIKLLMAFGVTDESFAIFTTEKREKATHMFFLGLVAITYLSWVVGTVAGAVMVRFLPENVASSFGIAFYAMFIGLLMPSVKKSLRLGIIVFISGLISWICNLFIGSSWSIVVSTLLGAFIGVFLLPDKEAAAE